MTTNFELTAAERASMEYGSAQHSSAFWKGLRAGRVRPPRNETNPHHGNNPQSRGFRNAWARGFAAGVLEIEGLETWTIMGHRDKCPTCQERPKWGRQAYCKPCRNERARQHRASRSRLRS